LIKDYTLEDRIQWITDKKDEGSLLFKNQEWQDAIDVWMKALCGFEFSKYKKQHGMHAKKRQEIDTTLKIPIVNNMALAF